MTKHAFASEKVMMQYLKALLTEEVELSVAELAPVAKLLEKVQPASPVTSRSHAPRIDDDLIGLYQPKGLDKSVAIEPLEEPELEQWVKKQAAVPPVKNNNYDVKQDAKFQALFFEVAGLMLAVPLKQLGGIHRLTELNHLIGAPKWLHGVMLHREDKFNVVDSAQWVMPEKYDKEMAESLNYQYVIVLGESRWGLACERLVNNINIEHGEVKWRDASGKRPWLAGLIKDKMCALLDVDEMINLLEQGMSSKDRP